jgi:hypothetical protein
MILLFTLFSLIAGCFVYFIPSIIASSRDAESANTIFILNLFLGWSGIVWLICLIWAITGDK